MSDKKIRNDNDWISVPKDNDDSEYIKHEYGIGDSYNESKRDSRDDEELLRLIRDDND